MRKAYSDFLQQEFHEYIVLGEIFEDFCIMADVDEDGERIFGDWLRDDRSVMAVREDGLNSDHLQHNL